jgi:hypothetical protein
MTAAVSEPKFHFFPQLPPELRNQIWRASLPDSLLHDIAPAIGLYKSGCWVPRKRTSSDPYYDPNNDDHTLFLEFRSDLLDPIELKIALASVNREACSVALAWAKELGLEIYLHSDRRAPVFGRPFDTNQDVLYISSDKWHNFVVDPYERRFESDTIGRLLSIEPYLKSIAFPETLFREERVLSDDIFRNYFSVETMLIVVGAQPDLRPVGEDTKIQRLWESQKTRGVEMLWNHDRGAFDCKSNDLDSNEDGHRLVEEVAEYFKRELARLPIQKLAIRPVSVRRG